MKKIILAVGYNPMVEKLADTGIAFARAWDAELCVVHVIADVSYSAMEYSPLAGFEGFSPDCAFKNLAEQEEDANRFLRAIVNYLGEGDRIHTKVLQGQPGDAIIDFATEYGADLVMIGAHQKRILGLTSGDTVAKLLKQTKIPVVVVPGSRPLPMKGKSTRELEYLEYT